MTPLKTQMTQHRSRSVGIVGAALVVALLVAGCSSPAPEPANAASATPTPGVTPAPTPTPTPTPTAAIGTVEAPQNAEEAIAAAEAAAQTYLDIRVEIEAEHPEDSSAIDTIAMDEVAATVHDIASDRVKTGILTTGHYEFDVTDASAGDFTGPSGTVYPFGAVTLTGCFITTAINNTNADGTPAAMASTRRGMARMTVLYMDTEKTWQLIQLGPTETVNVPC